MSMARQVTAISKPVFYRLRKISLISKYLTVDAAQLLVHALVTSKLDYCNSLLYGLPISTWLNSFSVFRMQLLVLLLFHQSSATLHLFLKISIGFRLISVLNLKYLPLPTRLFMVSHLPTLKIFSKSTIHHATLGLQRRIYLWSLRLTQIVIAIMLFLLL